jgi:acetyl esterase/lipase
MSMAVRTINDIEYRTLEDASLFLDLHRPDSDEEVPCVAYFHGGGWSRGSRKDWVDERLRPVAAQGVAVASVSYRFSSVAIYPAQLEDGGAALRWLRENGSDHGLRTQRIGTWGASAGGWIALMLALSGPDEKRADAACAWFAPTDLRTVAVERAAAGLPLPAFMAGRELPDMEAGLLGLRSVGDDLKLARRASPLAHAAGGHGPILLVHGDADGMLNVAQSLALDNAVRESGGDSQLLVLPGANHEDPAFHGPAVLAATAGFLRAAL